MKSEPRCYDHRYRQTFPAACSVCQRIKIEQDIVTRVVEALLSAGYLLQVSDGESHRPEQPTTDRAVILAELMDTDDEALIAVKPGIRRWVHFVYGNDGYDVVNDYTTSLESVMEPINKYADTLI